MKTFRIWFLACAVWSLEARDWEQSLTELQQFRIYPHVDMAVRMQQNTIIVLQRQSLTGLWLWCPITRHYC